MDQEPVREDETLEDLQLGGLVLLQKKKGFRFGMDSVLLADFARIGEKDEVADFGTGSGILPLLLIGRNKGSRFHCFEIQEEIASMAERTVRLNHLEERIRIHPADAAKAHEILPRCSMDAVICNPPYGIPGSTLSSPDASRAVSRSQDDNTISGFFRSAFLILKGKGRFCFIYPVQQMLMVMKQLQQAHLEPKRFQMVYPDAEKPANLVLIEAVKDARPMLQPMPPLILYNPDRSLTDQLKAVYHLE